MFKEVLKNFPDQFSWNPEIENGHKLIRKDITVVAGMGGSHLAGNILNAYDPSWDVIVHSDYDLDLPADVFKNSLIIASSYSGNTEETLAVFNMALNKKLALAVITSGGKLLELAQENDVPYIRLPNTDLEPRFTLGFSFRALLKIMDKKEALAESAGLVSSLNSNNCETAGRELALKLQNKIPVVYASLKNMPVAYNWKIKLNETTKIPAFCNFFPELNHNEMSGFDTQDRTSELMKCFHFVFLQDDADQPPILKRLALTKTILEQQGFKVEVVPLKGLTPLEKIFNSLLTADWASYYLAEFYGADPEKTPLTAEFKKLMGR